jgi:hypothetical protein
MVSPRNIVGVILRLREGEHRRYACVRTFEDGAPLVARLCGKDLREALPQRRPMGALMLIGQCRARDRVDPEARRKTFDGRPRRTDGRAFRRRRTGAPVSRTLSPRASLHRSPACIPQNIVDSSEAPSTIAASMACPCRMRASTSAHAMPNAATAAATEITDQVERGTGAPPARPIAWRTPDNAM